MEEFFWYNNLGFGVHCHIAICGFTVNDFVTWILLSVDNCVCVLVDYLLACFALHFSCCQNPAQFEKDNYDFESSSEQLFS